MKNKCSNVPVFQCSNDKGFTLIELIVVISITVMITGMVLAGMQTGKRSKDVSTSAEKLAAIIRQAQMMALTGKTIGGVRPDGGYGVYLNESTEPNSYYLFANDSEVDSYEYDAGDTIIQSFSLLEKVSFDSVPHSSIIFTPPQGTIWVSTGLGGSELTGANSSLIVLEHDDTIFIGYVRINSQGEIDVRITP